MNERELLQREAERAREDLRAGVEGLRRHGKELVDLPGLIREHPRLALILSSALGVAAGYLVRAPDVGGAVRRGARGSARFLGTAHRALRASGIWP